MIPFNIEFKTLSEGTAIFVNGSWYAHLTPDWVVGGWFLHQTGCRPVKVAESDAAPEAAQQAARARLIYLERVKLLPYGGKTCIERVPYAPDSNTATWRLIIWRKSSDKADALDAISSVEEADSLAALLRRTPWRVIPFASEVHGAIAALSGQKSGGMVKIDGTPITARTDSPEYKLRIYEDGIRCQRNTIDDSAPVEQWNPASQKWEILL